MNQQQANGMENIINCFNSLQQIINNVSRVICQEKHVILYESFLTYVIVQLRWYGVSVDFAVSAWHFPTKLELQNENNKVCLDI